MRGKDKIREAILNSLRECIKEAFQLSQERVPVITGNLKRSGNEIDIENGAQLYYLIFYSSFVERGVKAHIETVNGYYRGDGIYVKAFTRNMPERMPKEFIKSSMIDSFENFSSKFDFHLRNRFKKVVKKI